MSAGSDLVLQSLHDLTSHGPGHVHPGHPQGGHHELQHAVPVLPQFSLGRLHSKLKECFSFYFPLGPLYVLENYKQFGPSLGNLSLHELQSLQARRLSTTLPVNNDNHCHICGDNLPTPTGLKVHLLTHKT